jgi:hypothetical protein
MRTDEFNAVVRSFGFRAMSNAKPKRDGEINPETDYTKVESAKEENIRDLNIQLIPPRALIGR